MITCMFGWTLMCHHSHPELIDMGTEICLGRFKLYFCFWSWILSRTMWEGSKLASNMGQSYSTFIINIFISLCTCHMQYTEDVEKLKITWAGTRNRSSSLSPSSRSELAQSNLYQAIGKKIIVETLLRKILKDQ